MLTITVKDRWLFWIRKLLELLLGQPGTAAEKRALVAIYNDLDCAVDLALRELERRELLRRHGIKAPLPDPAEGPTN